MSEIIEVVFEGISYSNFLEGFLAITGLEADIKSIEILGLEGSFDFALGETQTLDKFINEETLSTLLVKPNELSLPSFTVRDSTLFVNKEQESLSFTFVFDEESFSTKELNGYFVPELRDWAIELKAKIGAKATYCGLEPATDEDTRLFTDKHLGPLKF